MAAAGAMLFCERPWSAMYMITVRVALPGPPVVSRYACPNMLADASTVVVVMKSITGRRPGRVTLRNDRHTPAPSSAAASYSSVLMPLRPARKITVLSPDVHQTVTPTSETHTHGVSTVQG